MNAAGPVRVDEQAPPDSNASCAGEETAAAEAPRPTAQAERKLPLPMVLAWLEVLKAWLAFFAELAALLGVRKSGTRPWRIKVARRSQTIALSDRDVERLLARQQDLKDMELIAKAAATCPLPESDFFSDPANVERLVRRILQENPPWLFVSRTLAGAEDGSAGDTAQYLYREQETYEKQYVTLFLPDDNWRDLPLASMTMRPVKHMEEVWQARLLDQVLPPEVLLDRMNRGEVQIPVRHQARHRLEFRTEERWMEVPVRKSVPIPIEQEGDGGRGAQLLYILLDCSASMRGGSATLALAAITAALRANLGHRNARYLYRRYSEQEQLWPSAVEPPMQARTLEEKDALVSLICATNFNGGATHVNHALNIALADVENLRRREHLEAAIMLVTDGRAEMMESTGLRLREAGARLHTVMVAPEPNPSLAAISESFTMLDIGPDVLPPVAAVPAAAPARARPVRTSFHI